MKGKKNCEVETISSLVIKEEHKVHLRKTTFWHLVEAITCGKVNAEICKKSDLLIKSIVSNYKPEQKAFHVNGKYVPIGTVDLNLIFGIVDSDKGIDLNVKHQEDSTFVLRRSSLARKVLRKEKELTTVKIKTSLKAVILGEKDEDYENVARLTVLYQLQDYEDVTRLNTWTVQKDEDYEDG